MKRFLVCMFFLGMFANGFSQTDPFEKVRAEMYKDFDSFKDSINDEFNRFKKTIWKEFKLIETKKKLTKPRVLPIATNTTKKPHKPIPFKITTNPDGNIVTKAPTVVTIPEIELPEDDFTSRISPKFRQKLLLMAKEMSNRENINFYGTEFGFYYNDLDFYLGNTVNEKSIKNAVKELYDNDDVQKYIQQWINYAGLMKLNDYGFLQLVRKTGQQIYNNDNKATLLTWLVLNKTGYKCQLGYAKNHLFLLAITKTKLLNTFSIFKNREIFRVLLFNNDEYNLMRSAGMIRSYEGNPFKTKYAIDFLFKQVPEIKGLNIDKTRKLFGESKTEKINLSYNKSFVDLLKELPTLDYDAYFSMPMHPNSKKRLKEQLSPFLAGKSETEKVQVLLSFVQFGFDYKFDKENFKRIERPQAAEEMIYYDYSDCEDHSALFAYLVNTFTKCEVVGILYSSHVTTAVKFPNAKPNGHYLPKPYNDYLICDATYIGASIGMSMNKFINVMPEAVFKVKKW